mgnify:CR=1 FL=1
MQNYIYFFHVPSLTAHEKLYLLFFDPSLIFLLISLTILPEIALIAYLTETMMLVWRADWSSGEDAMCPNNLLAHFMTARPPFILLLNAACVHKPAH